uniref:SMP domain-containing protein n=1 Tax=Oryza meridionalis TaxID=40149 RepID=A0A0E0F4H3_9ORYZ
MRHRPDDDADADDEKNNKAMTLKDVVDGATEVLPMNKLTTKEDADKVAAAAAQNDQS